MSLEKKSRRLTEVETLSVIALFLLVLNLRFPHTALVVAAAALLIIGLFVRPVASVMTTILIRLSTLLGTINSKIILFLVYFLFLTPLAIVFRLFAKNPLQLKKTPGQRSMYQSREHVFEKSDFDKMW
jgi:hypothetical protein